MEFYFQHQVYHKIRSDFFNVYSIIPQDHEDRVRFTGIFKKMTEEEKFDPSLLSLNPKESRAVAAVLGMAVVDALGASTEF